MNEFPGLPEAELRELSNQKMNELYRSGLLVMLLAHGPQINDPFPVNGDVNQFSVDKQFQGDTDAHLKASKTKKRGEFISEESITVDWDGSTMIIKGANQTYRGAWSRRKKTIKDAITKAFEDPIVTFPASFDDPTKRILL